MNVTTIEMPREQALKAYREYRQAVRENPDSTAADRAVMLGYKALANGKALINAADAIKAGGLDELARPRLALARAHWQHAHLDRRVDGGCLFTEDQRGRTKASRCVLPPNTFTWPPGRPFYQMPRSKAVVPMIPSPIRPGGDLSRFHILWEADWQEVPRDPMLLRQLDGDLYVVLAVWDLTELERSVLGARLRT
jgi:hypothetical protein